MLFEQFGVSKLHDLEPNIEQRHGNNASMRNLRRKVLCSAKEGLTSLRGPGSIAERKR